MSQNESNGGLISKQNTLIIKGGGILLMLIHHLFYSKETLPLYDDITIHGIGILNQLGIYCKLCVAIFVFVSGYGLAVSTSSDVKPMAFYKKRFMKLYMNYWFVWLLFVPVSVFLFGRTFANAYGDHVVVKSVLDFFGLLKMFGYDSYNPTWWFYNCIILLYLLFPLLREWLWRSPYLVLSIAITIGLFFPIPGVNVISGYILTFVTGMLLSRMPLRWIENVKWWHVLIALVFLSVWRFTKTCPKQIADAMLCFGIAAFLYKVALWSWLVKLLEELGKHSMNMFLTHTFIFSFWFRDYIYITRNPLIIFLSLVVCSYLLSVAIEYLKMRVGFYKLLNFYGRR
jgi:peptidoglycan/LPS O-acetylase OafA/YrhL